jgi:hypothetical protein
MREMEFLPDWYGQVRRRRTWVLAQAWATATLIVLLMTWTCVSHYRAMRAQNELRSVTSLVALTQKDVDELSLLAHDKATWAERGEVLERIGLSVNTTRLLSTVAQATPKGIALNGFNLQTDERAEVPRTGAAARALKDKAPLMDRKLRVRITGIAPGDAEVWDMVTKLTTYPFFEDVAMTNSKESDYEGRLVREFEVAFTIDLNAPPSK